MAKSKKKKNKIQKQAAVVAAANLSTEPSGYVETVPTDPLLTALNRWKTAFEEGTSEFFGTLVSDAKEFRRESNKYLRESLQVTKKKTGKESNKHIIHKNVLHKQETVREEAAIPRWKNVMSHAAALMHEFYFCRPTKAPEEYADGIEKGIGIERAEKISVTMHEFYFAHPSKSPEEHLDGIERGLVKRMAERVYQAYETFDESKLSWSNRKLTIPAALIVALWMMVATISGIRGYQATHAAYEVYYGDEVVATVGDQESFLEEVKEIEAELSDIHGMEKSLESEFRFEETYADQEEMTNRNAVYQFVSEQTAAYGYGYELQIEGHAVGTAKSEAEIDRAMENVFHRFVPEDQLGTAKCVQEIKKVRTRVKTEDTMSWLSLANVVVEESNHAKYHTVEAGEGMVLLSEMFDIPYEQLKTWNSDIKDSPEVGDKIRLTDEVAVTVRSTKTVEYDKSVAFETTVEKDDKAFVNQQVVKVAGANGVNRVVEEQVFENGKLVSKQAVSETVVQKPTNRVVVKGTKALPKYVASGSFLTPTRGRFTSGFGRRWGRMHNGIDIAGSYGTPIKAADGGKVIYAGWYAGLGKMVKIDHGNGYVTVYGHMSGFNVKVGQKVGKGEQIGKMGNTGNSTGTHLHFEVIYKGVHQNPKKYLP